MLNGVRSKPISLNLGRYLLVNDSRNPQRMSTQATGNTCYFQVYLFAILCKMGEPVLASDDSALDVPKDAKLEEAALRLSRQLLEWFVHEPSGVMRPLTNSNVVVRAAHCEPSADGHGGLRLARARSSARVAPTMMLVR